MIEPVMEELKILPQIEAIALGGSRAGNNYDEKSDYDIYVYCTHQIPEEVREEILKKYCSRIEIGNHYWEYEDNCILNSGVDIDILYRNLDEFAKGISEVVDEYKAHNGYTTCMWHNLMHCKIIFDRENRLQELQNKYRIPYPTELKENIISHNKKLLRYAMPAYELQIAKAVKRHDLPSINHRVTEFLASYFDILFAVNEMTHPGEKRLIDICQKNCRLLPVDFKENLELLFTHMYAHTEKIAEDIDRIIQELEALILQSA